MQFAHPRLLITSSLPLRFPSLSRRFSGFRFSVLPLVFRFSAVSLFFAGFPFFLRFSVFPPFPRRFSVLLRFSVSPPFLRSSTGFPFFRRFPAVSPFPRRFLRFSVLLRFPSLSALSQARCTAGGRNRGSLGGERCGRCGGGRCGGLRRAVPHFGVFRVQLWRKSFEWADFQQSCTAFRTKYGTARPGMHRYDLFYIHLQKTS